MGKISSKALVRIQKQRVPENASKDDMRNLSQKLERRITDMEKQAEPTAEKPGIKAIKMMGRGFSDIGKSLSTPETKQRPRISQMPGKRSEMGITTKIDLNFLKDPSLRNQDIRGNKRK